MIELGKQLVRKVALAMVRFSKTVYKGLKQVGYFTVVVPSIFIGPYIVRMVFISVMTVVVTTLVLTLVAPKIDEIVNPESNAVQKQYTTILEGDTLYVDSVPNLFTMSNQEAWQKLEHELLVGKFKTVKFRKWAGYGGDVQVGHEFIETLSLLKEQGKRVEVSVSGLAASMHAYAICGADLITIVPGASLLWHRPRRADGNPNLPFVIKILTNSDKSCKILSPSIVQLVEKGYTVIYYTENNKLQVKVLKSDDE